MHRFNRLWTQQAFRQFNTLGLTDSLVSKLENCGFSKATAVQKLAIPIIKSGKDVAIAAETGCGKSLSYLLPIMEQFINSNRRTTTPQSVILVPSHLLAVQLQKMIKQLDEDLHSKTNLLSSKNHEYTPSETSVIIATPRRLIQVF